MALSSRTIISHIASREGEFTLRDLTQELSRRDTRRNSKRTKKTNNAQSDRSASLIKEVLSELTAVGLLRRRRDRYTKIHPFKGEGIIRIRQSGHGVLTTEFGDEIFVHARDINNARDSDLVTVRVTDIRDGSLAGEVESVLRRGKDLYTARVIGTEGGNVVMVLIDVPGKMEVTSPLPPDGARIGDMALVRPLEQIVRGRQACEIVEPFSPDDDRYDVRRVTVKHALPGSHRDYKALKKLPQEGWDHGPRTDFTHLFTVTIDGANAKDFDDALSIERTRDEYILYVHIADVSSYVLPGTDLDDEAQARGTSHYLGETVIPMLPEILSNDLCSLREGIERLTMTVRARIAHNGEVRSAEFTRGRIRVDKRLTYEGASRILEQDGRDTVSEALKAMNECAEILYRRRIAEGGLELALTDETLVYRDGAVTDIRYAVRLPSHRIVEEAMLCANVLVSRALRNAGIPSLYRNHEPISRDSLLALKAFLRSVNISFNVTGNPARNIQEVLARVAGTEIERVVNLVVLRSLMLAFYSPEPLGHFGLGFRDYTHFTSPIRRYPDLVVHRCLKALMSGSPHPYSQEDLAGIGERCSELERVAQAAERDFLKIKSCRLMQDRVGEVFDATISGVSKYGVYVTLIGMPIDGMVPLRALTDDFYLVKEDEYTVVGRRFGRRYRLGDPVRVRLTAADIDRMTIDFDIA